MRDRFGASLPAIVTLDYPTLEVRVSPLFKVFVLKLLDLVSESARERVLLLLRPSLGLFTRNEGNSHVHRDSDTCRTIKEVTRALRTCW